MTSPVLIKRIFNKINSQLLIRNHGRQRQWDGILKGKKENQNLLTKNSVSSKTVLQI